MSHRRICWNASDVERTKTIGSTICDAFIYIIFPPKKWMHFDIVQMNKRNRKNRRRRSERWRKIILASTQHLAKHQFILSFSFRHFDVRMSVRSLCTIVVNGNEMMYICTIHSLCSLVKLMISELLWAIRTTQNKGLSFFILLSFPFACSFIRFFRFHSIFFCYREKT